MILVRPWLLDLLACPRDGLPLNPESTSLVCAHGHRYPVVRGIPVMLVEGAEPTHPAFNETRPYVKAFSHKRVAARVVNDGVHPFVRQAIVGTCGNMYRNVPHRLHRYPIPTLPLPEGYGLTFLDVGSNWGRWAISGAGKSYRAVALDPSLEAVLAGTEVSKQLGTDVAYVVGDARFLPFRDGALDVVFSYSVLQHFDKLVVQDVLEEMARVCSVAGFVLTQLPNRFGIRQLVNRIGQAIRRDSNPFRVRYWTPSEILQTFGSRIGPTSLGVDGFFSLNPRKEDADLLSYVHVVLVHASDGLRRLSKTRLFGWLAVVADSLWVTSTRQNGRGVR